MPPQEVIQSFMAKLADHGFSYSDSIGTAMLDAAVESSSKYAGIQDVINSMKADQVKAEMEAVEEILGSDYAGKTMSEISSDILSADAKDYDTDNKGNAYYNKYNDNRSTVERLIKERKAYIFLEKYCGIQLESKYWITSSDGVTRWTGETTGNVDTGAITGSDANISLTAGDVIGNTILTAEMMQTLAQKDGISLSSDGNTLIVGTGTEKTDRSIVPEIGNKYIATTSQAQNIKTGSNDWIVVATNYNDTITTGGADSIDAGASNDEITVGADYASILTGAGSDTVAISAEVKNVTLGDLNANDLLTISGTFEVGSAKVEDTVLVVTDKTGTRKIRLGDFENAKSAKVNSTTIATWLTNAGINLDNLLTSGKTLADTSAETSTAPNEDDERIDIDPDYTPSPATVAPNNEIQDQPTRSSNSTGNINVNLDNVTLKGGDLELDGSKVGEISNEFPNITSYTKNGLTINLVGTTSNTDGYPDNFTSKTFDQLTDDQKTIVAGLFKWWAKECLKLNEESYGISFNSSTAMVKEIGLFFYDSQGSDNTLAAVWNWSTSGTKENTTKLMLNVNMNYYSGIEETNFDGESSNTSGFLDRTLAHEFTHAVMATNIHYFNFLPQFIKEGSAELTHGIDDKRGSRIFSVAYDADRLSNAITLDDTSTGTTDAYAGGYMFFRYLAKQAALQTLLDDLDATDPLNIIGTEDNDSINNTLAGATIQALGGNDTISNSGSQVSIDGGDGDDTIDNYGSNVTIDGGEGNDTIENDNGSNATIKGGDGDDIIGNHGSQVSLNGGAGNDSIYNSSLGTLVTIDGGTGNDYISNWGSSSIIDGGDGNDYIHNWYVSNVTINGGEDDDTIFSGGDSVSIDGGAGNDSIDNYNFARNVTIDGGDGNDSILNDGNNVTIDGGEGNDYISSRGYNVIINSGRGNDSIYSYSSNVTIDGGDGDDTIDNYGEIISIDGGDGNDSISGGGSQLTIDGGAGDDSISNSGRNVTIDAGADNDNVSLIGTGSVLYYKAGEGNDTVWNFNGTDTLSISGSSYSTQVSGNDVIVNVASNSILLKNAKGKSFIINGKIEGDTSVDLKFIALTDGDDSISNYKDSVTIDGGAGHDYISNDGNNVTIDAGDGNDRIYNYEGSQVTIDGGDGNDSIYNGDYGNKLVLDGGAGNDSIENNGDSVSIDAGDGNDSIHNYGSQVTINSGAGNDLILNHYGDTISIDGGAGDDFIYNFSGESVSISGGAGNDSIDNRRSESVSIDGGAGDDYILNYSSSVSIDGGTGNDEIDNDGYNVIINDSAGNDSIYNGGSNVTIIGGAGNDVISLNSYAEDNLIVYKEGDGNDTISGFNSTSTLSISGGFYSTQVSGSDIIVTVGEDKITLVGVAKLAPISIDFAYKDPRLIEGTTGNDSINNTLAGATIQALGGNDSIYNEGGYVLYKYAEGDGNDLITGFNATSTLQIGDGTGTYSTVQSGDDLIVTSGLGNVTLLGAASLASNIVGVYHNPNMIELTENNNSTVSNIENATIQVAGNFNTTIQNLAANVLINGGGGADLINNWGAYTTINASAGDDTIQNGDEATNILITGGAGNDSVNNWATSVTIDAGDGNDGIYNDSLASAVSISGGAGDDSISNNGSNVTIDAGTGDDYINNNGSNVTFIYNSGDGNDLINGFNETSTLSISGDEYSSARSGNDILITVASGMITLGGAANLGTVNIIGKEKDPTLLKLTNADSSPVTVASVVKTIDASARTTAIKITGNANANTIKGGSNKDTISGGAGNDYILGNNGNDNLSGDAGNDKLVGGAGNDTLNGGSGNDSLSGGKGKDLFIFSGGKDTIADYVAGEDKVSVASSLGKESYNYSGKNLILGYGSNTLTITNGLDKKITFADGTTKTYTASGLFDASITAVTLPTSTTTFDTTKYSKLVTVDGSAASSKITIKGNSKANYFVAGANGSSIKGEAGNDKIFGGTGADILYGGNGNDTLSGGNGNDKLYGDAGNDSLVGGAGNDTLNGGSGNDSLNGGKGKDLFIFSGGKDTIADYVAGEDKVSVASSLGKESYNYSGKNLILGYGSNTLTITNGLDKGITFADGTTKTYTASGLFDASITAVTLPTSTTTFDTTKYSKLVTVDGSAASSKITIKGNSKANYFVAGANGSSIKGEAGNDKIFGGTGADILYGGNGNDTLSGGNGNDKLYGDAGNDSLVGGNGNDTLTGGSGNDSLNGGKGKDLFIFSGGNDTIADYVAGEDKVSVASSLGKESYNYSGKNLILGYGSNTLTITNGLDKGITFADGTTKTYTASGLFDASITAVTLPTSTTTFDATKYSKLVTVDGSAASSKITIKGNAKANYFVAGNNGSSIKGEAGNDKIFGGTGADILYGGSGNDTLSGGNGNDKLYGDAGNDSLVGGNGNDTLTGGSGNDSLNGGKGKDLFIFSGGNDTIADYVAGEDKVSVASSLGKESYNYSGKNLILGYGSNTLTITNGLDKGITFADGTTKTYTASGLFDASTTAVTLPTSTTTFDATKYSKLVTVDGSAASSKITIKGNAKANYFVAGNNGSSIKGEAGNDKIFGGTGADILYGGSGNDTLSGGNGNDKLYGDAGNDSLVGGNGNDTLTGGSGNDSLNGGKGKDLFIFSGGKDTIADYVAGEDKVSVASSLGKESYNYSGKNLILGYGSNTLTITNGLDKGITFADGTTKTYTASGLFDASITAVTFPTSTTTFDATKYSKLVTVDGSAASSKITIKGNSKANYFVAGNNGSSIKGEAGNDKIFGGTGADILYGGAGNDTLSGGNGNDKLYGDAGNDSIRGGKGNDSLNGGKGNDSLWGDAGNDTFLYADGDGKDTICGFANDDMLKITGTFSGTYNKSKKEVYFKVGSTSNAITLKDFSATTFNVNSTNYKISGSKLVKK